MSDVLGDFSMFELFKQEVEVHCAALNEGLLALENNPSDVTPVEPLMRAAHSVKGAARIIGFDTAVKLAHAMENCLVAVQKGSERLTSGRVDQLLRGVDLLQRIGDLTETTLDSWSADHGTAIEQLSEALSGPPPAEPRSGSSPPPAGATSSSEAPAVATAPAAPDSPAPPPEVAVPPAASEIEGQAAAKPAATEENAVRVSTRSLDRMMQLASETMIASRRFESLASSVVRLGVAQRRLGDMLGRGDRRTVPHDTLRHQAAAVEHALQQHGADLEQAAWRCEELSTALYHEVLRSRMRPFGEGVASFPRMVRDLARSLNKKISLTIVGESVPVDRDILRQLEAPLNHMLRNAVDHGLELPEERLAAGKPEQGRIVLEAHHHAGMLTIELRDDGRGIDPEAVRRRVIERRMVDAATAAALSHAELMEFLFLPGFSTRSDVTEVSGRGVGLDVVMSMVHAVSGTVRVTSQPGRSTTFSLRLPVTLSVIRAVLAKIRGELYAFPLSRLVRVLRVPLDDVRPIEGRQQFEMDGESVGLVEAATVLGLPGEGGGDSLNVVTIGQPGQLCGLIVDGLIGEQDLVVRPLDRRLGKVAHVSAAAVLETGEPLLIMDVDDLYHSVQLLLQEGRLRGATTVGGGAEAVAAHRVLVVDDSITVREVQRQLLKKHGYDAEVAVDGQDGWNALRCTHYDLLITDVDMPRMTGIELVRHVRQDPKLSELPIIIVSYKDREEDRLAGMEAGADAYLTKASFHDDSLLNTVQRLLSKE